MKMIRNPYKIKNKLIKIQIAPNSSLSPNIINLKNNYKNSNNHFSTNSLMSNSNSFLDNYISQSNSLITQININNINKSNSKYYYSNRNNYLPYNCNSYRELLNLYQNNTNIVTNKTGSNQKNINFVDSYYKFIEQKQKYINRKNINYSPNEKNIRNYNRRYNSQSPQYRKHENFSVKNLKSEKIMTRNYDFFKIRGNSSREEEMKINNNSYLGNFSLSMKNGNNNIFNVSPSSYNYNEIRNNNIFNNNSNFATYKNMSNNLILRNYATATNNIYQNYYNKDLSNYSNNNLFATSNNNISINIPNNNNTGYRQKKIQNLEKKIFKNVLIKFFVYLSKYCKNYLKQHFKYFLFILKKYIKSNSNNSVYTKDKLINSMSFDVYNDSPKKVMSKIKTNSNVLLKYIAVKEDDKKLLNQIRINNLKFLNLGSQRKNFKNYNLKNSLIKNENSKLMFNTLNLNYPKKFNNSKKQNIKNSMNNEKIYSKKIINHNRKNVNNYLNEKNCFSERRTKNNLYRDEFTKRNLKFKLYENYKSKDGKINIIQKVINICPFVIYSEKSFKEREMSNSKNINIKKYVNLKPIHEIIFYIKQNKNLHKNGKIVVNKRKNYSAEKRTLNINKNKMNIHKNINKNKSLYKFDIQVKSNYFININKINAFTAHLINVFYIIKYKNFFNKLKLLKKRIKNKKGKSNSSKNIATKESNRTILKNSKITFLKNFINCDNKEKKSKIRKVINYFKDK